MLSLQVYVAAVLNLLAGFGSIIGEAVHMCDTV